jgi:4-diphosphocytidyl-2-C-methyl-D-erythritol kinase
VIEEDSIKIPSTIKIKIMKLDLFSFAKINLNLHVLGRRDDGYHTLRTVFQTIDLFDELTFNFRESSSFHVVLEIPDSGLPTDGSNLIYRACTAFNNIYPMQHEVQVTAKKRIPIESGLGGGSSNAAATLIALSRFYNWPFDIEHLAKVAAEIGADVPFFFYGGTALGTNRGDVIESLPDWLALPLLIVVPPVSCSTSIIYKEYDRQNLLTVGSKSIKIPDVQRPESQRDYVSLVENDLEQVVFNLNPELDSIKKRLIDLGAIAAALTGSGSALFGLFSNTVDRENASREFPGSIQTRFLDRNEYQRSLGI